MLTQAQVEFFHENGYLRVEQVFPPDELAQMSADCVLLSARLTSLDDAARGAARTLRVVRRTNSTPAARSSSAMC